MNFKRIAIGLGVLLGHAVVHAQTIKETSAEARFQLDVHVPDAALAPLIPKGWSLSVAAQGPAKDANLRVIFIDRQTINGPDDKPVGKGANQLVYLAVPAKDPTGANVQLIVGGLTADPADSPGPFGNYIPAAEHSVTRTLKSASKGPTTGFQEWSFRGSSGEHFELRIAYESTIGNRGNPADVKFCSASDPAKCQISRQEQVLDILRNATTNPPDRVKEFSFQGGGGVFNKLFDGTEKLLSWDNIIWINRSVMVP
jgi:hypothetical protein